ncbi:MAG: aldo/keto reductase [Sporolactobacillus sp.]
MIQYRTVGRTGIKVSNLCFGAMSFGGDADEEKSKELFERCLDVGINFFDTADLYSHGRAEEILGKLMKGKREDLVVTSKVFFPITEHSGINEHGLSRKHMETAVNASLRRLQTDYIDFYILHYFDDETAIEETLRTLDDLQKQGKILHPGVSNWAAWQIVDALGISKRELLARFEIIEPLYNLAKRQVEAEILPMAQAKKLGVIPYSPLGGGLLTGKYGVNKRPESGRLTENNVNKFRYEDSLALADRFTQFAAEHDVKPATLAVAWVMSHPAVTAPIIGARNVAQLEDSLAAADFQMTAEMRSEINSLAPAPDPATGRTEENKLGHYGNNGSKLR